MMHQNITLTPSEYVHAAHAGFLRQASNVCKGRNDAHGYEGIGYDIHVLGALGEYVTAKSLALFWSGPGTLRGPDVGNLQVRTGSRHVYDLIIHPNDSNDAPFVLVTGTGLHYRVHGWCYGRDGKKPEYWKELVKGRPAYFVPQSALRPIAELQEVLNGVMA